MKAIKTYYLGCTNTLPARIKAIDSDGNSFIHSLTWSEGMKEDHKAACRGLCQKMKWYGTLCGGYTKTGMSWVWIDSETRLQVNPERESC